MSKTFRIKDFELGRPFQPYIIAEIGVNHEGCLETAKKLIESASRGGAHAAKFQTYSADKLAIKNSPAYWDTSKEPTSTQHALFGKYDSFQIDDYHELAKHCTAHDIDFLSTPFDLDAAEFLAPLMPVFKIASADITNVPLIRKCASYNKPLVISTGASTLKEMAFAVTEAMQSGASHLALLHCVLNYPTPEKNAQLGYIRILQKRFAKHTIGYSDHVVPDNAISSLQLATLLGCTILEKHFTNDKTLPGNDHYHAMDEIDLKAFCDQLKHFRVLYGDESKQLAHERDATKHARRSIVAASHIQKGDKLTKDNLTTKRPGHGISPVHWDTLVGSAAIEDIPADEPILWHQVSAIRKAID